MRKRTFRIPVLASTLLLACASTDEGDATSSAETTGGACVAQDFPEPGERVPGGFCGLSDGMCNAGVVCNTAENYCYVADDPCNGFDCGGADRACCTVVDDLPSCTCNDGFENQTFSHYCCPTEGDADPYCP